MHKCYIFFPFLSLWARTDLARTSNLFLTSCPALPDVGSGRNLYSGHTAILTRAPHRTLLNPSPRVVREPTARGKATPRRSSPRPGVTI